MYFEHCSNRFKPYDIWYLYDNKGFYERTLALGKCPICHKQVAELKERRKSDDKVYKQYVTGSSKVQHLAEINKNAVNYSMQDLKLRTSKITMPKSIRYGENKIIIKGNKRYKRESAVSWINGRKEVIKDKLLD